MNALRLFAVASAGTRAQLFTSLCYEWLHTSLALAPNGLVVWLVWQLVITQRIDTSFWYLPGLLAVSLLIQVWTAPRLVRRIHGLSYHLSCRLRSLLADHASRLGLGAFGTQQLGNFADQVNQAVNRFEFVLSHSLSNLLAAVSSPVLLLTLLLVLDWRMGLVMLASLLLALVLHQTIATWLRHSETAARASERELRARLSDYLQNLPLLKSHATRSWWEHSYCNMASTASRDQMLLEVAARPLGQLTSLVLDIGFVCTLWLGVILYVDDLAQPVNLLVFALIGYRVFEPVKVLYADWLLLRQVDDELAIAVTLLQQRPLPTDGSNARVDGCELVCTDLTFSYPGAETTLLRGVNAVFRQGATTALVGASGTGKTTLLQLCMRFWDPDQGSITIGGAALTSMTADDIAALYSPVFQQPYLLHDTLINNVRFGRPDATPTALHKVLEQSGCSRMADSLPQGLETNIGENGRLLSAGQQQLVAIARCMLKDAPIVLFDEATASLDPENSHLIYQAMQQLCHDKTVIVIAHTLSRISGADQILVLDAGGIAESGTHRQLLAHKGIYARMWHRQQQATGWHICRAKAH